MAPSNWLEMWPTGCATIGTSKHHHQQKLGPKELARNVIQMGIVAKLFT